MESITISVIPELMTNSAPQVDILKAYLLERRRALLAVTAAVTN